MILTVNQWPSDLRWAIYCNSHDRPGVRLLIIDQQVAVSGRAFLNGQCQ
jgi:hypothetical protein